MMRRLLLSFISNRLSSPLHFLFRTKRFAYYVMSFSERGLGFFPCRRLFVWSRPFYQLNSYNALAIASLGVLTGSIRFAIVDVIL